MKETFRLGVPGKGGVKPFTESERGIRLPVCTKLKLQEAPEFPSKRSPLAGMTFLSAATVTIGSVYWVTF